MTVSTVKLFVRLQSSNVVRAVSRGGFYALVDARGRCLSCLVVSALGLVRVLAAQLDVDHQCTVLGWRIRLLGSESPVTVAVC